MAIDYSKINMPKLLEMGNFKKRKRRSIIYSLTYPFMHLISGKNRKNDVVQSWYGDLYLRGMHTLYNNPLIPNRRMGIKIPHHILSSSSGLRQANMVMRDCHEGQVRDTGQPYAVHPTRVFLALYNAGIQYPPALAMALTHDMGEGRMPLLDYRDIIKEVIDKCMEQYLPDIRNECCCGRYINERFFSSSTISDHIEHSTPPDKKSTDSSGRTLHCEGFESGMIGNLGRENYETAKLMNLIEGVWQHGFPGLLSIATNLWQYHDNLTDPSPDSSRNERQARRFLDIYAHVYHVAVLPFQQDVLHLQSMAAKKRNKKAFFSLQGLEQLLTHEKIDEAEEIARNRLFPENSEEREIYRLSSQLCYDHYYSIGENPEGTYGRNLPDLTLMDEEGILNQLHDLKDFRDWLKEIVIGERIRDINNVFALINEKIRAA